MASDDTEMVFQEESNSSDHDSNASSPGELSFHCEDDDGASEATADDMSPTLIVEEANHLRSCLKKDAPQDEKKKKGISFIETPEIKYYVPEPAEGAIAMETSERVMFLDHLPLLAPEEKATPDGDSKEELVRSSPKYPLEDEVDPIKAGDVEDATAYLQESNSAPADMFPKAQKVEPDKMKTQMPEVSGQTGKFALKFGSRSVIDSSDDGVQQMPGNVLGALTSRSAEIFTQPMCVGEQLKKYRCPEETTWHYPPTNVVRKAGQTSLVSVDTFSHSASSPIARVGALRASRSLEATPAAVIYTVDRDCYSCMDNFVSKRFTDSSNETCRLRSQDRLLDHLPDRLLNETPLEASTMSTGANDIDINFDSCRANGIALDFDSSHADDCDAQDSDIVSPKDNAAIAMGQRRDESLAAMADDNQQVPRADQLAHTFASTHSLDDGPKYTAGGVGLQKEKKRRSVSSWIRKKFNGLRRLFTSCSRKRSGEEIETEGNSNVDIPTLSVQRLQSYTVSKEVFV